MQEERAALEANVTAQLEAEKAALLQVHTSEPSPVLKSFDLALALIQS